MMLNVLSSYNKVTCQLSWLLFAKRISTAASDQTHAHSALIIKRMQMIGYGIMFMLAWCIKQCCFCFYLFQQHHHSKNNWFHQNKIHKSNPSTNILPNFLPLISFHLTPKIKPNAGIVLAAHCRSLCRLCLTRFELDEAWILLDFVPFRVCCLGDNNHFTSIERGINCKTIA